MLFTDRINLINKVIVTPSGMPMSDYKKTISNNKTDVFIPFPLKEGLHLFGNHRPKEYLEIELKSVSKVSACANLFEI